MGSIEIINFNYSTDIHPNKMVTVIELLLATIIQQ